MKQMQSIRLIHLIKRKIKCWNKIFQIKMIQTIILISPSE